MKTVADLIEFLETLPKDAPLVEGNTLAWFSERLDESDLFRLRVCWPKNKPGDINWELNGKPIIKPCLMIYDYRKTDY